MQLLLDEQRSSPVTLLDTPFSTNSIGHQSEFSFGVLFVIGGFVLAAMAFITPILAAVLHVAGSLMVVFNSFRLVRAGEELEPFEQPVSNEGTESAEPSPKQAAQPA